MKARKITSIVLCVIFFVLSVGIFLLGGYLSSGGHHGVNSNTFAPASVKKVSEEKDITVCVYPTGSIPPHGYDRDHPIYVNLNDIDEGWIVCMYDGNCRLLFDISDADMEDVWGDYEKDHYYYAEIIPRERLRIKDITARHKDEPEDPFASGKVPMYLSCCIREESFNYKYPRFGGLICLAANAVVILLVLGANVMINKVRGY